MIQKIELRDFENHRDTVVDDLSPEFNLICGDSNSGKTSIVRALRLVAYNEWDPRCLRLGAKFCEIKVVTDKGVVQVRKGAGINEWEVTPKGGKMDVYENIGTKVLPEVAEIIGMKKVTLGDNEIAVNIMDQLEGHFMLAELNGKNASGSTRAQIVDEISGLSGIESLIKEISLENKRNTKEIKKKEDEIGELEEKIHDKDEIEKEVEILENVKKILDKRNEVIDKIEEIDKITEEAQIVKTHIEDIDKSLKSIPDVEAVEDLLKDVNDSLAFAVEADELINAIEGVTVEIIRVDKEINSIPDVEEAEKAIKGLSDKFIQVKEIGEILLEAERSKTDISTLNTSIKTAEDELNILIKEEDELKKSFKVCPLSLNPISGACVADINKG